MNITIPRIKDSEQLFFVAYGIFMVSAILEQTFYFKYFFEYYNYILLFSVVILIFRELRGMNHSVKTLLMAALFGGFAVIIFFTTSTSENIIVLLVFVYCSREIPFKKIAEFTIMISIVVVAFVVISAKLDIIENVVDELRNRAYLGFRYSLYCSGFIFNIIALEIYLKREKIKWKTLLIMLAVSAWVYMETDSRLSFYLTLGIILFAALLKIRPRFFEKKRMLCYIMISSFILCFAIGMYFTVNYNSGVEWQRELNSFLGRRLSLGKASLLRHGFKVFGQDVPWVGNGLNIYGKRNRGTYSYVDNLYIQMLQRYGIIFLATYLILHTAALIQCYRNKDYNLMLILTVLAVHAMIDDLILYLPYNTFWFVIGTMLIGGVRSRINKYRGNAILEESKE